MGLKVDKIHRVLKFNQSKWLKNYISLNTEKRQNANNDFEKDLFKLMSNSIFGKHCESMRKRKSVKFIRSEQEALKQLQKTNLFTFKILGEQLATVSSKPNKIYWKTPTLVGAVILDLAKLEMFKFHYQVMKTYFDCSLLYSDTDSLIYCIKTSDLERDLKIVQKEENCFDFSNYDENHQLYDCRNRMTVLKFKDELGGKVIEEFAALQPKMKSVKARTTEKFSARGVSKYCQSKLKHDDFKSTLQHKLIDVRENTRITSKTISSTQFRLIKNVYPLMTINDTSWKMASQLYLTDITEFASSSRKTLTWLTFVL